MHPLSSANTWLRSHGNLVLQLGWLFGSIFASFSIQNTSVVPFNYDNQTYYYCENWVGVAERDMQIYVTLSFVLTFLLPIIFLTISYGAIGRRLMRTQKYWCSYKQTVPFSRHSASRTHSSSSGSGAANNNNNNIQAVVLPPVTTLIPLQPVPAAPPASTLVSGSGNDVVVLPDNCSGTKSDSYIRGNTNKSSFKKIARTNSNIIESNNSSLRHYFGTNKSTITTNDPNSSNKIAIRFDRRNTQFLNKMRVSLFWQFSFAHFFSFHFI